MDDGSSGGSEHEGDTDGKVGLRTRTNGGGAGQMMMMMRLAVPAMTSRPIARQHYLGRHEEETLTFRGASQMRAGTEKEQGEGRMGGDEQGTGEGRRAMGEMDNRANGTAARSVRGRPRSRRDGWGHHELTGRHVGCSRVGCWVSGEGWWLKGASDQLGCPDLASLFSARGRGAWVLQPAAMTQLPTSSASLHRPLYAPQTKNEDPRR